MKALVNVDRPEHSLGKNIKLYELKNEKNYMGFLLQKYGKFWSFSLEH